MSEKSFAATPYSCHDEMIDSYIVVHGIRSWHLNMISSKLKDFEDIHVTAKKITSFFPRMNNAG